MNNINETCTKAIDKRNKLERAITKLSIQLADGEQLVNVFEVLDRKLGWLNEQIETLEAAGVESTKLEAAKMDKDIELDAVISYMDRNSGLAGKTRKEAIDTLKTNKVFKGYDKPAKRAGSVFDLAVEKGAIEAIKKMSSKTVRYRAAKS